MEGGHAESKHADVRWCHVVWGRVGALSVGLKACTLVWSWTGRARLVQSEIFGRRSARRQVGWHVDVVDACEWSGRVMRDFAWETARWVSRLPAGGGLG